MSTPFRHELKVTTSEPVKLKAANLPPGLRLVESVITGMPIETGVTETIVTAYTPTQSVSATVKISIREYIAAAASGDSGAANRAATSGLLVINKKTAIPTESLNISGMTFDPLSVTTVRFIGKSQTVESPALEVGNFYITAVTPLVPPGSYSVQVIQGTGADAKTTNANKIAIKAAPKIKAGSGTVTKGIADIGKRILTRARNNITGTALETIPTKATIDRQLANYERVTGSLEAKTPIALGNRAGTELTLDTDKLVSLDQTALSTLAVVAQEHKTDDLGKSASKLVKALSSGKSTSIDTAALAFENAIFAFTGKAAGRDLANSTQSELLQTIGYGVMFGGAIMLVAGLTLPGAAAVLAGGSAVALGRTPEFKDKVKELLDEFYNSIIPSANADTLLETTQQGVSSAAELNPATVLQDILVDSDTVTLNIFDHGTEDGDIVTLTVNGKVVFNELSLLNVGTEKKLKLSPGVNTFVLTAINEGSLVPNTGTVLISNVIAGSSFQQYDLSTGQSGSFRVVAP
ncbi:MAG TPA: hypothetical protein VEK08_19215 [Planctomycetota bacterium]|nr:hypothetical protein [Planctomycetota bacterium]